MMKFPKNLANEYEVSKGMISDILKAKDRWLSVDLNNSHQAGLRCEKKLPFVIIEEALSLLVENALQVGLNISDEILKIKALEFAFLCKEENSKDRPGLFWKMKPNHTILNGPVAGTKQLKDHVTVLLTCN
ncbi:unnamed protein product [Rhizophagus irregularis]|nr:unnamed protein product [Rhizophagus irregularis]